MILPSKKVFFDHEKGDSLGTCKIFGQCCRGPCCFSWNLEKSGCPQHFPGIPVATWVCERNITKKHMDMYWYESNMAVTVDLELVSESHTQVFPHTVNKKNCYPPSNRTRHGENSLQTHENPSLSYLSKPLPISTDHFRISLQQCYMAKKSIGHFQEGIDHEGPIH